MTTERSWWSGTNEVAVAVEAAVQEAIRVELTPEVIRAYEVAWWNKSDGTASDRRKAGLVAALLELGFEVVLSADK
jgi:hypothetical protein